MLVIDLYGWWYSRGLAWVARRLFVTSSQTIMNFFSISELSRTLFAPFRQDSLQLQNAPINIKLQAFAGNIISRVFGFLIRIVLILIGLVILLLNLLVSALAIALWPLVPIMPLIAILFVVFKVGV